MSFVSKNEIEQFSFDDCQISKIENTKEDLVLYLDALIVRERNSQNTNFTLSYADTTKVTLKNFRIYSAFLAGYKMYDANDKLLSEIPDREIAVTEWDSSLKKCEGAYLYRMMKATEEEASGLEDKRAFVYDIEVENYTDEGIPDFTGDTYVFRVGFDESVFSWDRYLNRVQN